MTALSLAATELLLACPTCAQNAETSPSVFWAMLGAMVLLPYPVTAAVIWVIRRAESDERAEAQESVVE